MRPFLLATLLFAGCSTKQPAASITSQRSSLAEGDCRKATDPADPNETPYFICPGFSGYTLNVRQVESGRTSLEVTNPDGKTFPLNYQDVITESMFAVDNQAEWRIAIENGKPTPVALMANVQAHEDAADPAKVTHTYIAIAKITPQMVCVTDKFIQQAQPEDAILRAADSARNRPCLPKRATNPTH